MLIVTHRTERRQNAAPQQSVALARGDRGTKDMDRDDAAHDEVGSAATDPTPIRAPGLDLVPDGGLPRDVLIRVVGPPGKAAVALPNAFTVARFIPARAPAAFSEPYTHLRGHLRSFACYDDALTKAGALMGA